MFELAAYNPDSPRAGTLGVPAGFPQQPFLENRDGNFAPRAMHRMPGTFRLLRSWESSGFIAIYLWSAKVNSR
jgi:hypothetical protein